jgi:hypothetical protein
VAFAFFGDASSGSALCFGHPPLSRVRQHFSGSLNALARWNAISIHAGRPTPSPGGTPCALGDPDAQSFQCYLHVCEALYRESIGASGVDHPSSLRSTTSVALTKVAYFRISFVFVHNYVCASMKFAFRALQNGRFKGRTPLSAACPEFHLSPSVCGEALLF